ncbi:iap-2 [Cryptophlebia peltastica nucleopolyhedrovirus]|uniref:Iap-2 n=1 Tax=Cryptophlebia peltastica nucleopolyhedrovirus TaxID=2304025 RepID=A0A346RNS2_9ABAC|nr:iap-2 [Cryptophlebia peltastica nucleopolyhedrovirus]AXS67719.1 iap-2 [Cryptophlebia peltastica nucleopolyhedrovirus]
MFLKSLPPPKNFYTDYENRLATFKDITNLMNQDKKFMARNGFYFDDQSFKCAFCSYIITKLNSKLLKYHTYSLCSESIRLMKRNETLRKESFIKFKTARKRVKMEAKLLAQNGFFFYGRNNEVRCVDCGLVIVKLNRNDSVEFIHSTSKNCSFVKRSQPSAPDLQEIDDEICMEDKAIWSNKIYPDLQNFKEEHKLMSTTVSPNDDNKTCKICFDKSIEICFSPCGHFATCEQCAERCKNCCICREKIKEKIKVYLQ